MPVFEPSVGGQQRYTFRHVGPRSAVFPTSPAANTSFLSRTDMVARPLPSAEIPGSPDWVSGSWTTRLDDSGEMSLLLPNAISSDGVPWRSRFDPAGHLHWIEAWDNGELDQVCVIDQLPQTDSQQVSVHGSDGWWLLKKAYERDWTVVQSPRDVIERGTMLWVPTVVDNFPAGTINSQWLQSTANGGTITLGPSGGITLAAPAVNNANAVIQTNAVNLTTATSIWRTTCQLSAVNVTANVSGQSGGITYIVNEATTSYSITFNAGYATYGAAGVTMSQVQIPAGPTYSLAIESDGEWVSAYVNGLLIGSSRRTLATTTQLAINAEAFSGAADPAVSFTIGGIFLEQQQPFLQRGTDKGDYVLPGIASTFPNGGLHARYFNDLDLQSDTNWLSKILAPPRTQGYGSTTPAEYANQQDAQINGQANPTGAASVNWSAIWFGSIWLPLSKGDIGIGINAPAYTGFRVWIGKTRFGDQIIDHWNASSNATPYNQVTRLTASSLAGTLPYGGGTANRDGWYPICIEYAVGNTSAAAPTLFLAGPAGGNIPYNWTDPGGTSYSTASAFVNVPATSLSPLGCVDQRYQGISHFDLVQQTVQAYGYQASVEPYALESGLFPGVLAPRIREGHDTDVELKPDHGPRQDGEGLTNYASALDASDFASSMQGNGAGLQNGGTGQLQALVYDPATLNASLFDAQGWQDFSDASFPSLLQAQLSTQLGLRLSPWQALTADPQGRARWANTWPLPGSLSKMRWRPGDGLRINAPEINVVDTSPRQMLVVTRQITPNGQTGTQATFANRPRTPARSLKQQLYQATRWQRNYQRQLVSITGTYQSGVSIPAGASVIPASIVSLLLTDKLVGARVRILQNSAAQSLSLTVNGTAVSSLGPWTKIPASIDIGSVAAPDASGRLYVSLHNNGASATTVDWQLIVDVLR